MGIELMSWRHPICCVLLGAVFTTACGDGDTVQKGEENKDKGALPDPCKENERVVSKACVACPSGTFSSGGVYPIGADTVCQPVLCMVNERVQDNACVACVGGAVNDAGDDASGQDTTCNAPQKALSCAENFRVLAGACEACPLGSVNEPGDDTGGGDTQCDALLCKEDERVEENRCVSCAAGKTNAAGDDATGENTLCDAKMCASNFFVQNNSCVMCPPGETRAAGDDPSGEDTTCDPVVCKQNERVQANLCVACAKGTNDAGDLANGEDTRCDVDLTPRRLSLALNVTCKVTDEGGVLCSGDNRTGQLGTGTTFNSPLPVGVVGLAPKKAISVDTGGVTSCALMEDRTVKCWGNNRSGQLGNGSSQSRTLPVDVLAPLGNQLLSDMVKVGVGSDYACALDLKGDLWCWGDYQIGQASNRPQKIENLGGLVVDFALSNGHMCVALSPQGVKCWGENRFNQTGSSVMTPPGNPVVNTPFEVQGLTSPVTQLSLGRTHSCALLDQGDVMCWGANFSGQLGGRPSNPSARAIKVASLSEVVQISTGESHSCALEKSGSLKCWGDNREGQLAQSDIGVSGTGPVEINGLAGEVVEHASGADSVCALFVNGDTWCWGSNESGNLGMGGQLNNFQANLVKGLEQGVTSVSIGFGFACAVTQDDGVQCWGGNSSGRLGDGTKLKSLKPVKVGGLTKKIVAVTTGNEHACSLSQEGEVKCWGSNAFGQLGTGLLVDESSATLVKGLSERVIQVEAGANHTCALGESKAVYCWGRNRSGQLGQPGQTVLEATPVNEIMGEVIALETGFDSSCALTSLGVQCWGNNFYGQIGDGTRTQRGRPVATQLSSDEVAQISIYNNHGCALLKDNSAECWGSNVFNQLANGTRQNSLLPVKLVIPNAGTILSVESGDVSTCVLTNTGVKCAGFGFNGWLGNGGPTPSMTFVDVLGLQGQTVVELAAGLLTTCALTDMGAVYCWGSSRSGVLGEPFVTSIDQPTKTQF